MSTQATHCSLCQTMPCGAPGHRCQSPGANPEHWAVDVASDLLERVLAPAPCPTPRPPQAPTTAPPRDSSEESAKAPPRALRCHLACVIAHDRPCQSLLPALPRTARRPLLLPPVEPALLLSAVPPPPLAPPPFAACAPRWCVMAPAAPPPWPPAVRRITVFLPPTLRWWRRRLPARTHAREQQPARPHTTPPAFAACCHCVVAYVALAAAASIVAIVAVAIPLRVLRSGRAAAPNTRAATAAPVPAPPAVARVRCRSCGKRSWAHRWAYCLMRQLGGCRIQHPGWCRMRRSKERRVRCRARSALPRVPCCIPFRALVLAGPACRAGFLPLPGHRPACALPAHAGYVIAIAVRRTNRVPSVPEHARSAGQCLGRRRVRCRGTRCPSPTCHT
jgi:hypothetical protein